MARKSKFGPPDPEPFSLEEAQLIAIEVIGSGRGARLLHHRLNQARSSVNLYQTHDAAGGPYAREQALASIARSRKTLPGKIAPLIGEGLSGEAESARGFLRYYVGKQLNPTSPEAALGDGAIDLCLEMAARGDAGAIENVFAAATAGHHAAAAEPRRGQADRHRADVALDYLIAELLVTYEEVFQRPAGLSWHKDQRPDGPLIRFLRLVLPRLGYRLSDVAIRSRIQRLPADHWPHLYPKAASR
jgi:hypothetical protein